MARFGDLRGILQYVPQFRGRVFVLALDGAVAASDNFSNILLDLAVLHSLSIRIVLVHGASAQIARLAAERGVTPSNTTGIGPTDAATLQVSIDAITRLTSDIMQDLTGLGLRAATTNAVIAHPAGIVGGVEQERTGKIDRVSASSLNTFLEEGMIPIVAPLGYDGKGNTLRLNSDACAAAVGASLGASKVIYVTADDVGIEPRQLSVPDAKSLLKDPASGLSDGFRSKLRCGARACGEGVSRVHIVDGKVNEALLEELFSNEGIGTMIYVDAYLQIRAARVPDVAEILALLRKSIEDDELVRRSRRQILERLGDYWVLEVDHNVVGTVALHMHRDEQICELACLFIKETHEGQGYGKKLVAFAEKKARELGAGRIVALSTQAYRFFRDRNGYEVGDPGILPKARRDRHRRSGRNSMILYKQLR